MGQSALQTLQQIQPGIDGADLRQAYILHQLICQAQAVPTPPGSPAEIRMLADTFNNVATTSQGVGGQLTTLANTTVPRTWQGATGQDATGVVTSLGADLALLPQAFHQAAQTLSTWADQLNDAMNKAANAWGELDQAKSMLSGIGADQQSWGLDQARDFTDFNTDQFIAARQLATSAMDDLISAAQTVATEGQVVVSTLLSLVSDTTKPSAAAAMAALHAPAPAGLTGNPVQAAQTALADYNAVKDGLSQPPTPDQLAKLQDLSNQLSQYSSNPIFASELMGQLGPDGLLQFTERVASFNNYGFSKPPGFRDEIGKIQAGLGTALATATNGDSEPQADPGFLDQLRGLENKTYDSSYNGYQIIGVLMHAPNAQFSQAFVANFSNDVLAHENYNSNVWIDPNTADRKYPLNDIDTLGDGSDPMTGALTALSKSPDDAATFFDPANNDHLQYLLTQRHWVASDNAVQADGWSGPYTALGNALDAAASNTSDPVSRNIMAHVVWAIGGNADLGGMGGTIPDGMSTSLTDMMAHYIASGDVNNAMASGAGGLLNNPQLDTKIWGHDTGGGTEGTSALTNVLAKLAQTPADGSVLVHSEMAYSTSQLAGLSNLAAGTPLNSTQWDDVKNTANNGAQIIGFLTNFQESGMYAYPNSWTQRLTAVVNWTLDQVPFAKIPLGGVPQPIANYSTGQIQSGTQGIVDNLISGFSGQLDPAAAAANSQLYTNASHVYDQNQGDVALQFKQVISQYSGVDQDVVGSNVTNGVVGSFGNGYGGLSDHGPGKANDNPFQ